MTFDKQQFIKEQMKYLNETFNFSVPESDCIEQVLDEAITKAYSKGYNDGSRDGIMVMDKLR